MSKKESSEIFNLKVNGNHNNGCYMFVIHWNILKNHLSLMKELYLLEITGGYTRASTVVMLISFKALGSTNLLMK